MEMGLSKFDKKKWIEEKRKNFILEKNSYDTWYINTFKLKHHRYTKKKCTVNHYDKKLYG